MISSRQHPQASLVRSNTTATSTGRTARPQPPRFRSHITGGWNEMTDDEHDRLNEADEDADTDAADDGSPGWGLEKGMQLFEVSAATEQG